MSRRNGAPRIGLILLTLVGIVLASAGLATAVTMSVSAPVQARADLAALSGGAAGTSRTPSSASTPDAGSAEAWKPVPVDASGSRSITDLTDGATSRVTIDVLGVPLSAGQAGALVATILSLPVLIALALLVLSPRRRSWWRRVVRRQHG
ncbi:hypothetical protein [Clavibacter sp. MX14-G9D]|uniref:hypothetical protein n=1 Tax=Clavibacter sp. MX14-G9D TaxID=3064656 RepID=UPI00293F24D7|nr:hypothetical protein [Clavibacter sp. MX14-G9D]